METITLYIDKLATGDKIVTFPASQINESYLRMRVQLPYLEYIGERSVVLSPEDDIEQILSVYFNRAAFNLKEVSCRCICDVCNSPEYQEGPNSWPYICVECPYLERNGDKAN